MSNLREPIETRDGIPALILTAGWLAYEDACNDGMKWFLDHSTNGERAITRAFLFEVAEEGDYKWLEWLYSALLGLELYCFDDLYDTPSLDITRWGWLYSNLRDAVDYMMICLYGDIDPFDENEIL